MVVELAALDWVVVFFDKSLHGESQNMHLGINNNSNLARRIWPSIIGQKRFGVKHFWLARFWINII